MSKPVEVEFLMKDKLTPGMNKAEREALELRNTVRLLEAELERLRLAGETAAPNLDQSTNIAQIHALEKRLEELRSQLKQLQEESESVRVTPEDMPNAEKKFNGLHNSIQQMAREMPSLAMGPQMFFLAISNNLPIFADEVSRARKEYDELVKSGKKGTPVWKQILSSLFSWQTALTTGIMLLVMYGDEIIDWTRSLFGAKNGVDALRKAMEEKNEVEKESHALSIRTRAELDSVIRELTTFTGTKEQEKSKVEELNRKYGDSFGYYKTLAEWYDILIKKGGIYIDSLFAQAKAQSYIKKAVEIDEQINDVKSKGKEEFRPMWGDGGKANMFLGGDNLDHYGSDPAEVAFTKRIKELEEQKEHSLKQAEWFQNEFVKKSKDAGLGDYRPIEPDPTNPDDLKREAEARLRSEKEAGERLLELQRHNRQDEINLYEESRCKKLEQINHDYEERKVEITRREKELSELNKSSGQSPELTGEQQGEIDKANALNLQERQKAVAEVYKAEFDAMRYHLKEYGMFQQRKLAIAEEYAEKIRDATGEGEKLSLSVERDSLLAGVASQELKANIDWSTVFGEFGGMFHDVIAPELEKLKSYIQTDEFKNATPESQEVLISAIRQMEQSLGGADRASFRGLGSDIAAYRKNLAALEDAQVRYGESYTELVAAQQRYIQAMQGGTEEEQEIAKTALDTAQANADAAAENMQAMQTVADESQRVLSDTARTLKTSMDGVVSGLRQIASGSLSGAYEGLITFGNSAEKIGGRLGKAFGKVADVLEDVPVIGWIVQIIDLLKDGISVLIGGLLDAVFNAVNGILDDVLSGKLLVTVGESLLQGIGKVFDTLTFGGFNNLFGGGESDKTLEKDIEYLTVSNEDLRRSIDNLADKMSNTAVSEASGVYERQKRLLEEQIKNTQEMMYRSGKAYSNGFLGIGGSHSSNHRVNEAMSGDDWDRISEVVGRRIGSASDFWGLSSEEMARVADEATDLYSKIKSYADDGHKDAAQYMDEYIGYYKQLEELQESYYEKLTGISFDSVRDRFRSLLLDMNSDAGVFAEDLDRTMLQAVIEGLMSEEYTERLRNWYRNFADSMKDGSMTDKELESLRHEYDGIVSDAMSDRDALLDALDMSDSKGKRQQGRSGGFNAMTQEQGTKLEGLFTSGLQHWSSIDERVENVIDRMNTAEGHLARIEENTRASAGHLVEIREEIRKIIRDGLKVK